MKDHVWDYLPEVTEALTERLKEAEKRWGNAWQIAPAEGMMGRIQHHIEDELLAYQTTGVTDRLLDVIGYGVILYIREILEGENEGGDETTETQQLHKGLS